VSLEKETAPEIGEISKGREGSLGRRTGAKDSTPKPFAVVIIGGLKRGEWGRFGTLEAAAEVAAKLRRHGMAADVVDTSEVL